MSRNDKALSTYKLQNTKYKAIKNTPLKIFYKTSHTIVTSSRWKHLLSIKKKRENGMIFCNGSLPDFAQLKCLAAIP